MEKNETATMLAKKDAIHPLIADTKAFAFVYEMGAGYRSRLYKKVNDYLRPSRSQVTVKRWFLYPEKSIPNDNFKFFHDIMLSSLVEVLHEFMHEFDIDRKALDEKISRTNKMLESYGEN